MPCLILTGHGSVGKTTLANKLKEKALQHDLIDKVVVINEESACPDWTKNQCYESQLSEKKTRAALKSSFDRVVGALDSSSRTLVILDSMNYIKGFRYELFCISKAVGEKHGVLWVLNQQKTIRDWNSKRPKDEKYEGDLLEELIRRYEPPDERNRWDRPLFRIDISPEQDTKDSQRAAEALQKSVYNMHDLEKTMGSTGASTDKSAQDSAAKSTSSQVPRRSAFKRKTTKSAGTEVKAAAHDAQIEHSSTKQQISQSDTAAGKKPDDRPLTVDEQLEAILDAFLTKTSNLKEGASTRIHIAENPDVLQNLDAITQQVISAWSTAQNSHTGGKLVINVNSLTFTLDYKRTISLAEMRNLRKQYMKWVAVHPPTDKTEEGIATSFLQFVEAQL